MANDESMRPQGPTLPKLVAVSGVKNSGKTTLLCGLVRALTARGLRVAAIKHDGHDFAPDVPGTDSYRLREAGAMGVAVYSDARFMLTREWDEPDVELLRGQFADADLILYEGGKSTGWPKVEVVRAAVSHSPVCDPATLLALCTDTDARLEGVPTFGLDDCDALADHLLAYVQRG